MPVIPARLPSAVFPLASVRFNIEIVPELTNSTLEPELFAALSAYMVTALPEIEPTSPDIVSIGGVVLACKLIKNWLI
jgi:hypothetical protein